VLKFDKELDSVMVTGGCGFLGKHVCMELKNRGYHEIHVVSRRVDMGNIKWCQENRFIYEVADLREYSQVKDVFRSGNFKAVINLAASVGGIGANQDQSAEFMKDTLLIGTNMVDVAYHDQNMNKNGRFVQIGTVCSYPKFTPVPFKEEDIWNGYPEETNAGYGIAKKTIMELVKQYNKQYWKKFDGINIVPVNLYGPGDNFHPQSSHVIPALIRKYIEAKENNIPNVFLWGTGEASREFLYVKDAARGIVTAMEDHDGGDFINLGSGKEIKIKELAKLISSLVGYKGDTIYDVSKPDGQPRRCLDIEKAKRSFGFEAKQDFIEGLKETIKWYKKWHME
jgi:GDP-L-fucose synthase